MFADRVYDQDFFAAMADRGFYVFTSSPCHAAARPMAPVSPRPPLNQCAPAAAGAIIPTASPLAEAA
ncbi:hypothetical protein D3C71_460680 [compost metagenome]